MPRSRVLVVYGTRPEAVKLAPLIRLLRGATDLEPHVCVTAQHREMLDQVNSLFTIDPDVDLDLMEERQSTEALTARVLTGVGDVVAQVRPDAVVVQGDTTTAFAAALAAFHARVPVVHVEAGLRSGDDRNPFPEEMNRRLVSQLSSLHLAPTPGNRSNLLAEGIAVDDVVVTGNTVIDALHWALSQDPLPIDEGLRRVLDGGDGPVLLVTAHRRESWGAPLRAVGEALRGLVERHPDLTVLLPLHRNPAVTESILPAVASVRGVEVVQPLGYTDFVLALRRATVVLTDSGGVQEEAPSLGKPVLVLRDVTERPEAVEAGCVRLVGTRADHVVEAVTGLLTDPIRYDRMARAVNPYGDGRAAERSVAALRYLLTGAPRPADFDPNAVGPPADRPQLDAPPTPLDPTH